MSELKANAWDKQLFDWRCCQVGLVRLRFVELDPTFGNLGENDLKSILVAFLFRWSFVMICEIPSSIMQPFVKLPNKSLINHVHERQGDSSFLSLKASL